MDNVQIDRVEKIQVRAVNEPSAGVYSYKAGTPIVTFDLASSNKFLRASTLRLNGKVKFLTGAGAALDNKGLKGGAATDVKISPRVALNSIFQNVSIASGATNMTIESVRQYGRLVATLVPATHGAQDLLQQQGVVSMTTGVQDSTAVMMNNEMSFSLRIFAGLFNSSQAIPMGVSGMNGLTLTFELASDQQVLSGADASSGTGASYQISDLSITADMLVPDAEGQQKLAIPGTSQFAYNTFQSLYSVISSSDATQTYNLASSNVLSVFQNFLPVNHTNTYSQDGFATEMLQNSTGDAILNKVSFSRSGVKLGLDYDLDVQKQSEEGLPETGVMVNALNSIQPYFAISNMSHQPLLFPYGTSDKRIYDDATQVFKTVDSGDRAFFIGLATDRVSEQGLDFRGMPYSTRIQSTLDQTQPNSVFTFYLTKNILQTSQQGVAVVS